MISDTAPKLNAEKATRLRQKRKPILAENLLGAWSISLGLIEKIRASLFAIKLSGL
jgi:hypothetical protein